MEPLLREKIAEAMAEDFVGNYIFDKDELTSIYAEASNILRRIRCEWGTEIPRYNYELIFIALVNLSKEWNVDEESALFDFFYKKLLGSNGSGKVYTQIANVIQSLSDCKKIFILDSYTKKFYATLCSHSFAPLSSIESFFEMCWEIYCEDLGQQYEKNDPAFDLIVKSLQNKFTSLGSNNENDFQIGSNIYSFRAGIRGLAIDEPKLMSKLLDETMASIHTLFNNEPLAQDKYIRVLINDWWKRKEQDFGNKSPRTPSISERIIKDYSQIKAKYILQDGIAKIVVPPFRLNNNFDYEPYIEIKANGEKVKCESMETRGSGILMATKAYECELSNFTFDKTIDLNVEITHCNKIIYNSKTTLNREFILFNNTKEVLSQDCLPGMYFLYIPDLSLLLRYPDDIHRSFLNTYSIDAIEGDVVQSNNKTIFFISEINNRKLYFFAKERSDVLFRFEDEEYKVIDGELCVDVEQNVDVKDYGVRYEESSFKLSDFDFENIYERRRYKISSLLNVGEPQHIAVFKYSDNSILASINLIKFKNISISFDKELYFGKECIGTVKFITEKYNECAEFNINDGEVTIPLSNGELVLFPPVLKWRIDNNEWNLKESSKGIWYKSFTNSSILSIELPKTMSCRAALENSFIEQSGNKLDFKLGQTVYALKEDDKYSRNSFCLFIRTNTNHFYPLCEKIYYREFFTNEPIYIFPNFYQVCWFPEYYIGDVDSTFRFEIIGKQGIIYSKDLTTKKETFAIPNIDDGYYKYRIVLKSKGFLNKEKELYSKKIVMGDERNFKYKNKTLAICEAMLSNKENPTRIKPIYVDSISYVGTENGCDYYSGSLFINDQYGRKTYLRSMKNEFNSYMKVNPLRIEFRNDKSAYIMYGLNVEKGTISFYDGFYLDSMGKTTICEKIFGEKTECIDYFIFEVKQNV